MVGERVNLRAVWAAVLHELVWKCALDQGRHLAVSEVDDADADVLDGSKCRGEKQIA